MVCLMQFLASGTQCLSLDVTPEAINVQVYMVATDSKSAFCAALCALMEISLAAFATEAFSDKKQAGSPK